MKLFLAAAMTASVLSFGSTGAFAQAAPAPTAPATGSNVNPQTGQTTAKDKIHSKMANKSCKGHKISGMKKC